MVSRGWVPLLLVLLVGCGAPKRVVRLETGRGEPLVYTPRTDAEPVALDGGELEEALKKLGRDVPASMSPREAALRFLELSDVRASPAVRGRLGVVWVEDPRRGRLLALEEPDDAETELAKAYGRWCKRRNTPGDCLRLLEEGPTLDEEARRTLAFHMALGMVWEETAEALEGVTEREAVMAQLSTTGAVYFGLWLLPEPASGHLC